MRLDPNEMVLLSLLQEWDSLSHEGVSDNHARLRFGVPTRRVKGGHDGVEVIAVDPAYEPAESLKLVDQRLESHHLLRGAVGLLIVHIDDRDQIVELVVCSRHHGFPLRTLIKFSVREQRKDPALGALPLQPEAHADRDTQAEP